MSVRLDHGEDTLVEVHEINVTPFIDVILVLLIIFMIAAPLATVDISVDLPAANAERSQRPDKPLFLTLKTDLSLMLDNDAVSRTTLAAVGIARLFYVAMVVYLLLVGTQRPGVIIALLFAWGIGEGLAQPLWISFLAGMTALIFGCTPSALIGGFRRRRNRGACRWRC